MRKIPVDDAQIFRTLDVIRASGKINMFEAPAALMTAFGLSKTEATGAFWRWTEQYSSETDSSKEPNVQA